MLQFVDEEPKRDIVDFAAGRSLSLANLATVVARALTSWSGIPARVVAEGASETVSVVEASRPAQTTLRYPDPEAVVYRAALDYLTVAQDSEI
jgi:hypothetical protein